MKNVKLFLGSLLLIAADNVSLTCQGTSFTGEGIGYGVYVNGYDNVLIDGYNV
jgi:hypothetical protein